MRSLARRVLRPTALALALATATTALSACGSENDVDQRALLAALDRAIATPRTFVHIDQGLNTKTVVSGEVSDSLRYRLLLTVDGKPTWQQVVKDDAVANLFLDRNKVATYAGAGSSPAVQVVSDYQVIAPFLPKEVPPPAYGQLPKTQPVEPSLALAALQQGKWVVDPDGAPVLPTVGTSAEQLATTPFLRPLLMLSAVRAEVDQTNFQFIKKYSKDDLSPLFKPEDDPFPKPQDGEVRYDVGQPPLPAVTATSQDSRPEPPEDVSLRKLAIYLRDGKVVAVRENFDILDRLEDLARLYQIPLQLDPSAGTVTQQRIGQLLVNLIQPEKPVPYRVHEEQLLLSYPPERPEIALPKPAVSADLSLLPGQGTPTEEEAAQSSTDTPADATASTAPTG